MTRRESNNAIVGALALAAAGGLVVAGISTGTGSSVPATVPSTGSGQAPATASGQASTSTLPTVSSVSATLSNGSVHDVTTPMIVQLASAYLEAQAATLPASLPASPRPPVPASGPPTVPAPGPALPALAAHIAGSEPRGVGIYSAGHIADVTIANAYVCGFEQNVVCENYKGGLTVSRLISERAYHPADEKTGYYEGQGLYLQSIDGPVTITGSYFGWNGWQTGRSVTSRGMFWHGIYANGLASPPGISGCIFDNNANCGVQLRNGGTVSDCTFINNGTGALVVMGKVKFVNCLFLGSHLYFDGNNWTGGAALCNYWPVELDNCVFAGIAHQADTPAGGPATARVFPAGCIVSGGVWNNDNNPPWAAPPKDTRALVTATRCTIAGWTAPAFNGASKHNGAGFIVLPDPIVYDASATIAAVVANQITPAAGQAKIQSDVRALLKN